MLEFIQLRCPYCGESFDSSIDLSGGDQDYTEDCAVCCKPISVRVRVDAQDELIDVNTRRDHD